MKDGRKIKRGDQDGMIMDLDHAVFKNKLKQIKLDTNEENLIICELEAPKECECVADINVIAYKVFGEIAEHQSTIEHIIKPGKIIYKFLIQGWGDAHEGEIIFVGETVNKILSKYTGVIEK